MRNEVEVAFSFEEGADVRPSTFPVHSGKPLQQFTTPVFINQNRTGPAGLLQCGIEQH